MGTTAQRSLKVSVKCRGLSREMDPTMFDEILEAPYIFNRLVAYKSDLIHSATGIFRLGSCTRLQTHGRRLLLEDWLVG